MKKTLSRRMALAGMAAATVFPAPSAFADNNRYSGDYRSDAGNLMSDLILSTKEEIGFGLTLANDGRILALEITRKQRRIVIDNMAGDEITLAGCSKADPLLWQWKAANALVVAGDRNFAGMIGILFKDRPDLAAKTLTDLAGIRRQLRSAVSYFVAPRRPLSKAAHQPNAVYQTTTP